MAVIFRVRCSSLVFSEETVSGEDRALLIGYHETSDQLYWRSYVTGRPTLQLRFSARYLRLVL